jgi:hypothetical protein
MSVHTPLHSKRADFAEVWIAPSTNWRQRGGERSDVWQVPVLLQVSPCLQSYRWAGYHPPGLQLPPASPEMCRCRCCKVLGPQVLGGIMTIPARSDVQFSPVDLGAVWAWTRNVCNSWLTSWLQIVVHMNGLAGHMPCGLFACMLQAGNAGLRFW